MKKTILIIEDDNDVRQTLAEIFQACGYEVCEASHGLEALECLAKIPQPSLIILDSMMPIMDGPTFFAEFRKLEKYHSVPVVLFSAIADKVEIEGLADRLQKPGDVDQILKLVSKYCEA